MSSPRARPATVTVEDIDALAGLPLLGVPVREPVSDSLDKDVAAIEAVQAVLNQSKKKPSYDAWVKRFVEHAPEEEERCRPRLVAVAPTARCMSLFVLPGPPFKVVRRVVLPLAACLAHGQSVALAPAALATIYHDLSMLKCHITSSKKNEPFVVSGSQHPRTSSSSGSRSISPS